MCLLLLLGSSFEKKIRHKSETNSVSREMNPSVELLCEASVSGTGQVLCAAQAVEIYRCKLRLLQPNSFESCLQQAESRIKGKSVPVAGMFKVSPKTVRDIWNRRTWACTTRFLWAQEDDQASSLPGPSAKLV